jgi:hypothetical protein
MEDIKLRSALLTLIILFALLLYPMSLGLTLYDPYRLGYGESWFVATLLFIALLAWARKYYLIATCIAIAILAWALGWYESDNLWDYLLDPWLVIYASFSITFGVARIFLCKRKIAQV